MAEDARKLRTLLAIAESDKEALEKKLGNINRKFENHKEIHAKLQQRFRHLQDNIDAIAEAPLREAEERFNKERTQLIDRITALEAENAKLRMESRGKSRHIQQLEQALEVKAGETVVEDPSQLARAAGDLIEAREREADASKRMFQAQKDLATADRRARILEGELEVQTRRGNELDEEFKDHMKRTQAREAAMEAQHEEDAHQLSVLREELEVCENNLISTSSELKRCSERNQELRKRLKVSREEVTALTDQLANKSRQHQEMKEHLAAAQEAFQRMAKNLRAAKEREEEVLRRQSQSELIMEQFRRQKIELGELNSKLYVANQDLSQLSRAKALAVSAKNQASAKKKSAEAELRAAMNRVAYANQKASAEAEARSRAEDEVKELRMEILNLHRHIKSMVETGGLRPVEEARTRRPSSSSGYRSGSFSTGGRLPPPESMSRTAPSTAPASSSTRPAPGSSTLPASSAPQGRGAGVPNGTMSKRRSGRSKEGRGKNGTRSRKGTSRSSASTPTLPQPGVGALSSLDSPATPLEPVGVWHSPRTPGESTVSDTLADSA